MIGGNHETRNHETLNHDVALNCVNRCVVRREKKIQRKSSVAPPDFYGTYDSHKFCEWIGHLDYYFDLYEFSDALRV